MRRPAVVRVLLKSLPWILVVVLAFYIYVVALYFLYSNQQRVSKYADDGDHPVHDHLVLEPMTVELSGALNTWDKVMRFRRRRFEKAQKRSPDIKGPGEDGEAVYLSAEEEEESSRLFSKETFNVVASNKIAMDRRIRDLRPPA